MWRARRGGAGRARVPGRVCGGGGDGGRHGRGGGGGEAGEAFELHGGHARVFRVGSRCGRLVSGGAVNRTPFGTVAGMATDAHALPAAVRADRRALVAIAAGHMSSDLCQGAVPALLPFLIRDRGLSYAGATALLLALTVSSSVIQPLLGHASDRMQGAWLMPAGVLVGGVGIAARRDHRRLSRDAGRRRRRRHRRGGLPSRGRALRPARRRLGGVDGHGPLLGRRQRRLRRRPGRRRRPASPRSGFAARSSSR